MHRIYFDLCPNYLLGWGTAKTVLRVLSAFAKAITAALPSVGGSKGERERERERVWSDLYPSWSLAAIPCVALSSCIPDDQRSPAPPVHTKLLLFALWKCKAAISSRGNKHVYFLALALWSP